MSETERCLINDSHNATAIGCNYKANEAARPCPQIMARRKLSDITNLTQKGSLSIQEQKSQSIPTTTKEYIEQLRMENLALMKMLQHRNKIIEQSGIELERLRLNLIKMRDQNRQLALSHTLMLAELNSGKDRLKALQHELGCKTGLLQARSKLEENLIEEEEPSKEDEDLKKPRMAKRRLRSLSLGSSEHSQSEDNAGIRPSVRRQSSRFKAVEPDGDSLAETDPIRTLPDGTVLSTSVDESAKIKDHASTRPSVMRQSARFKPATPCQLPDETVQENGSTSAETSVKNEGCDVQRPSARRQSSRFKAVEPDGDSLSETDSTFLIHTLPDGTVPSTSIDALAKSKDHATTRPSVRRQSARFKAATPCQLPDETVQENGSTSAETSVKNEGHDVQRPSARRQSTRCKAKRSKQENDLLDKDGTISLSCSSSLDAPVPENGSTYVEALVKIEAPVQRPPARRQSTISKAKRSRQADDVLDMDDATSPKCSSLNEPVQENGSTSMETSVKNEEDRSCSDKRSESRESGKPSLGRPSRAAVRKVQSYKEIPLKVKMRRPE